MRRDSDPQRGAAGQRARDSLFLLVVITVGLGALINAGVTLLMEPKPQAWFWWVELVLLNLLALVLGYLGLARDDGRIGRATVEIELALAYALSGARQRARLLRRKSYGITNDAREAWSTLFPHGLALAGREGDFAQQITPEHLALVRYLLVSLIAQRGENLRAPGMDFKLLRAEMPLEAVPLDKLPPTVRENPFTVARGRAHPQQLWLPASCQLEAFDQGPLLLRLRWDAPRGGWSCLLRALRRPPGGELRVRWLRPIVRAKERERVYGHLAARATAEASVQVVLTQMVIEVESRWNALSSVARFRDWAQNLARYLECELDYWAWREYYLERTIDDLNWKIGYVDQQSGELGMAVRLQRLDQRLARLEQHLWPDEPPSGSGDGVWVRAVASDACDDPPG